MVSESFLNEEFEDWESVFVEIDGLLVPFFIESLRVSSESSAVITFCDINSSEKAKEFVNCKVFQLISIAGEVELIKTPEVVIGYKVIDVKAGAIGRIEEVVDYKTNLLFRILKGETEILIPVTAELIVKVNHRKKEMTIQAPEGLLELYLP